MKADGTVRICGDYKLTINQVSSADPYPLPRIKDLFASLSGGKRFSKLNLCSFFSPQIEYLGHLINEKGLHPTQSKLKAIIDAPAPSTVTELKSFLGLLNYYCKFLPNLSSTLHPLYSLQQSTKWKWGPEEKETFQKAKALLSSPRLLVHFDPVKKLVLSCDPSAYGLGVVLSDSKEDGAEQPISYASRTLTSAEKKYSQLDKEALAVVYGVTKFHQYLYGRDFTLFTDHKPLTYLFSSDRAVPQMALSSTTLGPHSELLSILGCFPPWKR